MSESKKNITAKENYFKVPEGYFETLPEQIRQKSIHEKFHEKIASNKKITFYVASAAAIIAIALISYFTLNKTQNTFQSDLLTIEKSDISDYLAENMSETEIIEAMHDEIAFFDSQQLSLLPDDSTKNHNEVEVILDTSIKADDIYEYLNNENIELETL